MLKFFPIYQYSLSHQGAVNLGSILAGSLGTKARSLSSSRPLELMVDLLVFHEKLKIFAEAHLVVAWIISPIWNKRNMKCLSGIVKTECMSLKVFICFAVVDVKIWSNSSLIAVVRNEGR